MFVFITFEGLDGSGKSTQFRLFADFLQAQGYNVLETREPGGTDIGDQIRDILHSLDNTEMHPHTELLLYVASRAQLITQVIRPHLDSGDIVLSDRFADSTVAYQGYGHGIDLQALNMLLNFATGGLKPDITIYLDITAEQGLQRRQEAAIKGEEWNRLDAQKLAFHQRVYQGYQNLIGDDPSRWIVINALGTVEEVHRTICDRLLPMLPVTN
jgi:dTMP kinase